MGQYYEAITKSSNRITVYNRDVIRNGQREYTLAKLTEHSWWYNEFVNAVCLDIYNREKPTKVIWMGDYANTFLQCNDLTEFNGLKQRQIYDLWKRTWRTDKDVAVQVSDFTLDGKYINNHTKRQYVCCSDYYERNQAEGWCMHLLPLLTCIGNGLGGGDYNRPSDDSTTELVGTWAWDEITIEDKPMEDYEEIYPVFKESM